MDSTYKQRLQSPTKAKTSPGSPDKRTRSGLYSDRTPKQLRDSFSLIGSQTTPEKKHPHFDACSKFTYHQVLQNEILGHQLAPPNSPTKPIVLGVPVVPPQKPQPTSRLFTYARKQQSLDDSLYSLSPLGLRSQALLSSPKKAPRKIPKVPFKVLEAPSIQDDFYLNLVDWSSQNILAVGLHQSVYLWNASTSSVTKLCDLPGEAQVASVSWMGRGSHLAVGSTQGSLTLWDVASQKQVRSFHGHKSRVGTLAWSNSPRWMLSSGSRDRVILHHDVRTQGPIANVGKLVGHKQEVCGLKWGYNPTSFLASGGNDNRLLLWDQRMFNSSHANSIDASSPQPFQTFTSHRAAVKAITWSPHQRGLLASGGGTADQRIRFWNTGSQVCNLAWSKNVNELVSTHGYSQNQISVWHYPSMTEVASLTGHSMRVLYLAVSPDGQTIVTGAGDETLRFWSLFPQAPSSPASQQLTSPYSALHEIR